MLTLPLVLAILPLSALAHDHSVSHPLLAERATSSKKSLFTKSHGTYPTTDVPGPAPLAAWTSAYNAAKKAGQIPSIPPTTIVNYNPVYPSSYKGNPCNFYSTKCNATGDIHTGPSGVAGIAFDDGPQPASTALLTYLSKQKQKATHFLIGSRIVDNPDVFTDTVTSGGHLAVHTWSHPMMTSLTDAEVLGELGWTIQIIWDKSGKLPAFWRPPYGDVDDRVRAIAKHVYGLTTVTWSEDPRDWCIESSGQSACGVGNGPQNVAELNAELAHFIKDPKKGGLIILEHSISTKQVAAFEKLYPNMKKAGWKPKAIPDMTGLSWYQ
jgi:peptidoglycan/xylan/chitin deacetylase (PgdA/CDA1 family)